jgi:hypothetical protein
MLVRVAPLVLYDGTFALKGGTAINLFFRDMPRLSVDLDLAFPDYRMPRDLALTAINSAIREADRRLQRLGFQTRLSAAPQVGETGMFVRRGAVEIKAEANYIMRGTVNPVQRASLSPRAREALLADVELPLLSLEDVYAGKLVAALDRQHPRDLFDVLQLFAGEGITPGIRRCFVVYLASHNRPTHEVLFPTLKDISHEYSGSFRGMPVEPVELAQLLAARERLVHELPRSLTNEEREFLISLALAEPQWDLIDVPQLRELPAIRWKLDNLVRLRGANPAKLHEQADELARKMQNA